jgi:Winged helix DNA-binding domain
VVTLTRNQVLRRRFVAQQLDRAPGALTGTGWAADVAALDLGVQDTGQDGALWGLALRGAPVTAAAAPGEVALVWGLRGAPHAYRSGELPDVARALVPFSEADARKRVYDAARPLVAAGIDVSRALATVGAAMRRLVTGPTVKGELSGRVAAALDEPFRRWCAPCGATHLYEMTFRLGALHAGLALGPGTSPPVLEPSPPWAARHLETFADQVATDPARRGGPDRLDVVRGYLRLQGPARPADVAAYLDAPVADVRERWSDLADELVEVDVEGERRWALAAGEDEVEGEVAAAADRLAAQRPGVVRLLGPFDLFLQGKDRELLVPDADRRRELWPTLGRPGAVVHDGEVVGTWRPRAAGRRLRIQVTAWGPWSPAVERGVDEQAERLAAFRGLVHAGRA